MARIVVSLWLLILRAGSEDSLVMLAVSLRKLKGIVLD